MTRCAEVGRDVEAGLLEAVAHRKGQIVLLARHVDLTSPEGIKAIRKSVAESPKQLEARFGISASTIEGWEQGRRKPDPAARILLAVIEKISERSKGALNAA